MLGYLGFKHIITNIKKNYKGEVISYILEDGRSVSKGEVVELSKEGTIAGVSSNMLSKKEEFLNSLPENETNMNLWNLPVVY